MELFWENGPEYWHTLCDWYAEGAKFPLQSPIALYHDDTEEPVDEDLSFHYHRERFTEKNLKIRFILFHIIKKVT